MGFTALLWFFGLIYFAACAWLVTVVLLQEGKTGGLSNADSISQAPSALSDTFGAGGSQKGLFNVTAWTAGIFFVLALGLTLMGNMKEQAGGNLNLEGGITEPAAQGTTAPEGAAMENVTIDEGAAEE